MVDLQQLPHQGAADVPRTRRGNSRSTRSFLLTGLVVLPVLFVSLSSIASNTDPNRKISLEERRRAMGQIMGYPSWGLEGRPVFEFSGLLVVGLYPSGMDLVIPSVNPEASFLEALLHCGVSVQVRHLLNDV